MRNRPKPLDHPEAEGERKGFRSWRSQGAVGNVSVDVAVKTGICCG